MATFASKLFCISSDRAIIRRMNCIHLSALIKCGSKTNILQIPAHWAVIFPRFFRAIHFEGAEKINFAVFNRNNSKWKIRTCFFSAHESTRRRHNTCIIILYFDAAKPRKFVGGLFYYFALNLQFLKTEGANALTKIWLCQIFLWASAEELCVQK